MFSREARIIDAVAGIYQEVLVFLQRIEALLAARCEAHKTINIFPMNLTSTI